MRFIDPKGLVEQIEKRQKTIMRELHALDIPEERLITTLIPWVKSRKVELNIELSEVTKELETAKRDKNRGRR